MQYVHYAARVSSPTAHMPVADRSRQQTSDGGGSLMAGQRTSTGWPSKEGPDQRSGKIQAKGRASAKAQRPWFRKKRFVVPLVVVVLLVVASALSGGDSTTPVDDDTRSTDVTGRRDAGQGHRSRQ